MSSDCCCWELCMTLPSRGQGNGPGNKDNSSRAWWEGFAMPATREAEVSHTIKAYFGYRGSSGPAWASWLLSQEGWGCSSEVECLHSMCEGLGMIQTPMSHRWRTESRKWHLEHFGKEIEQKSNCTAGLHCWLGQASWPDLSLGAATR